MDNTPFYDVAGFLLLGAIGFSVGFFLRKRLAVRTLQEAQKEAVKVLSDAKRDGENIRKSASLEMKEELYKSKVKFEEEMSARRKELEQMEWRLKEQESTFSRKFDLIEKKERELRRMGEEFLDRDRALKAKEARLSQMIQEENEKLERVARLSAEEAKRELIANLEEGARLEAAQMLKEIKERTQRVAEKEAKKIIVDAIQRCAADQVVESTVSVVVLPNDEMKGRIIGREGRNIRSFEMATGVNVIIDDTPEAVILSAFDPVRRETARIALEKLISDGRIHPGRIEDVVQKAQKEMEELIQQAGEEAVYEVGIHGLHPDLIHHLGRLKYRTSYGQNVLQHLKETAIIAGLMATELHFDYKLARRAALLHDVGKSLTHESEGTHVQLGAELTRKYKEDPVVINAIEAHHDDAEPKSVIAVLVQAADALSGARPGARRETFETYIRRLEKLEELADSFDGVQKSYAIQAGREIRVIVEPTKVDDATIDHLCNEIARKIERELEYPGHIKVSVIRETRSVDYAR
ncbi:MAG: ribonuclease Y [Candidatus Glassbacteria bacterium RBG_16_58_8]|uniref:Ribonuclease Y n=1 Tax=Candidatus Glassbacteria bacterium RBG_16_58_8 TaxID=1817866 RepID=A0A1F5YC42_9BACT|nr:MAG: ribonuclease Y [Candidatus Glassbacteria bacterium RBG_16_58_8]